MADALNTLARLRRMEAEQAKRTLAEAVSAEIAAEQTLTQARKIVADETRVAAAVLPGAFAAWLPRATAWIAQAQTRQAEADRAGEAARQALAERRAALKATETVQAAREAEYRLKMARSAENRRAELWKPRE